MIVASECENNDDLFPGKRLGIAETASAIILESYPMGDKGFSRFLFRDNVESLHAYTSYYKPEDSKPYLHVVKENDLESLYIACILPVVQELLQSADIDLNNINKIFPPQISSRFITELSEALMIPRKKFIDVVGEGADLFSSSLPYALEHAFEKKLLNSGDTGLMIVVGSGIQVGCAIYHF
jgi:3-oxoacyl-[acyl-carrier-protein] synthase III